MTTQGNDKGSHEDAAQRRLRAFDLRVAGYSYREIGAALGVSEATAHRDVMTTLGTLAELEQTKAEEWRELELARLDAAQSALFQHLEAGEPAVINAWVKVSESRRKLLGLDAPAQIQVAGGLSAPAYVALRAAVLAMLPIEQRLMLAEALDQVIDVTPVDRSDDGA